MTMSNTAIGVCLCMTSSKIFSIDVLATSHYEGRILAGALWWWRGGGGEFKNKLQIIQLKNNCLSRLTYQLCQGDLRVNATSHTPTSARCN